MSIIKMWLLLHPELLFWLAFVFEVEPNKCDFVALEVSSRSARSGLSGATSGHRLSSHCILLLVVVYDAWDLVGRVFAKLRGCGVKKLTLMLMW